MIKEITLFICTILLLSFASTPEPHVNSETESFSFEELYSAEEISLPPIQYEAADDGVKLAYREYLPEQIEAVLLFYHGGGAYNGAGYEYIGSSLNESCNIVVITPDIRGHGASEGKRGDTPDVDQVFDDVTIFINYSKTKYPDKKLFLGGHSSGVGLVLNYANYSAKEEVEGFVLLSPQFGFRSETEREDNPNPFAIVKNNYFIDNARFGKYGNTEAVFFNYSEENLEQDPNLISAITVNMANAITPASPAEQLQLIKQPLAVWIGEKDELLDAEKVVSFVKNNNPEAYVEMLENEKHLSVILSAPEYIGLWINSKLK